MASVKSCQYTLITFYSPGSLMPNKTTQVVSSRDLHHIARMAPEHAFCFTIQDFVEKSTTVDSEHFVKTEQASEISGCFYLGGVLFTIAQLQARSDMAIMIANLQKNGYKKAIQCQAGNWRPFSEQDTLLDTLT